MVMNKGKKSGVSLNPDDFVEGGGLLDNVDVTWKECRFKMFDYNGTAPETPALRITMEVEGQEEEEQNQYWSAGSPQEWEPNEDGTALNAIGSARGVSKSSKFSSLMKSVLDAGFPKDKIGNDISVLDGLQCHMVRVKAPARPGLVKAPRADGRVYEETILVVDSISKMPAGIKGGKAAAVKGKGKAVTEEPEEADIEGKTTLSILSILESNPKLDKKKLAGLIFAENKNDPDRNAMMKLAYNDEFLEAGSWTFKNGTVTK